MGSGWRSQSIEKYYNDMRDQDFEPEDPSATELCLSEIGVRPQYEEILGEQYMVITEEIHEEYRNFFEQRGLEIPEINTDNENGSATSRITEDGKGLVIVDETLEPEEARSTLYHEETHIAAGPINIDELNSEGLAYARQNYHRKQKGMEKTKYPQIPLLKTVGGQWEEAYAKAADDLGDRKALELAVDALNYDLTILEKLKMPLSNVYVNRFESSQLS